MTTLSEADSKARLAPFGVPFPTEHLVETAEAAVATAAALGGPVALKLCGDNIAHKTERGLVRLDVAEVDVRDAAAALLAAARPEDASTGVLVAPMVRGTRELIAGANLDPQFGMTVMIGIGGILAEALGDVAIRLAPITRRDALDMLDDLSSQAMLGPFRGEPGVDREAVAGVLLALSAAATDGDDVVSIDLNPLVIAQGRPVAVDALVEVR